MTTRHVRDRKRVAWVYPLPEMELDMSWKWGHAAKIFFDEPSGERGGDRFCSFVWRYVRVWMRGHLP